MAYAHLLGLLCAAVAHGAPTRRSSILSRRVSDRIEWSEQSATSTRGAALCITDRVRNPSTLLTAQKHVLDWLDADLLAYSSDDSVDTWRSMNSSSSLAPAGLLHLPEDELDEKGFYADLQPFSDQYLQYGGSVAPLACNRSTDTWESEPECAHVLSIYVGQQRCYDMVTAAEKRRGQRYQWVLWSRGELQWMANHPPLGVMSTDRVWIPQCSSDFYGIYDRHAAMPRKLAHHYLSRYSMIKSGKMLKALEAMPPPDNRFAHNSEVLLHTTLSANGVAVGRFPCVAALSCCDGCFTDGCCDVKVTNSEGEETIFRVKSYGEHVPEGVGTGAEDAGIWNFDRPPTSLEGAWAGTQAGCAAEGEDWHTAAPCDPEAGRMRSAAFVGQTTALRAKDAKTLMPVSRSPEAEAYLSVCSDTCKRPDVLQCSTRSSYRTFQRNATGQQQPEQLEQPEQQQKQQSEQQKQQQQQPEQQQPEQKQPEQLEQPAQPAPEAPAKAKMSLDGSRETTLCPTGYRIEVRPSGGDVCRRIDGSDNWVPPAGCEISSLDHEPFTVTQGTSLPCKHSDDAITPKPMAQGALPGVVDTACMPLCSELPRSWEDKCGWQGSCNGCVQCSRWASEDRKDANERLMRPVHPIATSPCPEGFKLRVGKMSSGDSCHRADGSGDWTAPNGCTIVHGEPNTVWEKGMGPCEVTWTLGRGEESVSAFLNGTKPSGHACLAECSELTPPWAEKCTWAPACSGCDECAATANVLDRTDKPKPDVFSHDWKELVNPRRCNSEDVACEDDNLDRLVNAYFTKGNANTAVDKESIDTIASLRGRHCGIVQIINNNVLYKPPPPDSVYANTTWDDFQERSWPHMVSLLGHIDSSLLDAMRRFKQSHTWGPQGRDQLLWPWANHRFDDVACMLRRATELETLPDVEMLVCPDDTYQHQPPLMLDDDMEWDKVWSSVAHVPVLTANGSPENWDHAIPVPMPGRGAPNPRESYNTYRSASYSSSEFAHRVDGTDTSCEAPAWDQRANSALFRGAVYERFCRQYEAEQFKRGPLERTPCARIALLNELAKVGGDMIDARASSSSEEHTRMELDPLDECAWERSKLLLVIGNFQGYADRVASSLMKSSPTVLVDAGGFEWYYPLLVDGLHYARSDPTAKSIVHTVARMLNGTTDLQGMARKSKEFARGVLPLDRAAAYMARVAKRYQRVMSYKPTAREGFSQPMCGGEGPSNAPPREAVSTELKSKGSANPYLHVVPEGVTCKAAIFVAGMPRTGSTLQRTLVMKALQHLQVSVGSPLAPTKGGELYWNSPRHAGWDAAAASSYYAQEDQGWKNLTADDVLVYKTHEFDAEALRLCRTQIVVTQHRNLLDEYTSAVTAFNMTGDVAASHAAGSIKLWMADYRDWKQNATDGALDIRYEDVVDDIDAVFASTVAFLAKRLGVPERASSTNLPSVKDLGEKEANAMLPSSGAAASPELKRACRDAVQEAHDYLTGSEDDPARLGLEWGLGGVGEQGRPSQLARPGLA